MAFIKIGRLADIPVGSVKVFKVRGREIAVCNAAGVVYAIDNICTHDNGSLDQGELMGCEIECPRHGARFDVRNGEATEKPAVLPVDTFSVRIDEDVIEIDA